MPFIAVVLQYNIQGLAHPCTAIGFSAQGAQQKGTAGAGTELLFREKEKSILCRLGLGEVSDSLEKYSDAFSQLFLGREATLTPTYLLMSSLLSEKEMEI